MIGTLLNRESLNEPIASNLWLLFEENLSSQLQFSWLSMFALLEPENPSVFKEEVR